MDRVVGGLGSRDIGTAEREQAQIPQKITSIKAPGVYSPMSHSEQLKYQNY